MDLDWYNINLLQPLPNTPIFETMVQQGLVDAINSEVMKFNSGPFGKKRKKEITYSHRASPFENKNLDSIPPKAEFEDIWFYMNYHLNFERLFKVTSPTKLDQQLKYISNISRSIAPDDPFPMYFYAYLQKKVTGRIEKEIISRLESCLESSEYWATLFGECNLSVTQLKSGEKA